MENWKLVLVVAILVAAWLIDARLFAILLAVTAATVALAFWQARARARRDVASPLQRALRAALPDSREEDEGTLRLVRGGTALTLSFPTYPDGEERPTACVEVRATAATERVPLCFVAQRRALAVALPPLVPNATIFEAPLECDLAPTPLPTAALADTFELMSSAPEAMARVFAAGLADGLGPLADEAPPSLERAAFDGAHLDVLLAPEGPIETPALERRLAQVGHLAMALDDAIARVSSPPPTREPTP